MPVCKSAAAFTLVLISALLGGCADNRPTYEVVAARLPAVQPGKARVWVYTQEQFNPNANAQCLCPSLNGSVEVKMQPYECIYFDCAAGEAHLKVRQIRGLFEWGQTSITLHLTSGETRYVWIHAKEGGLELLPNKIEAIMVEPDEGKAKISACHYVGREPQN